MPWDLVIKAAIAFLPALLLVFVFDRLDVFDMVDAGQLARLMLVGAGCCLVSYQLNGWSLDGLPIGFTDYSRFISPFIEEALKAGFLVWLLLRRRLLARRVSWTAWSPTATRTTSICPPNSQLASR